MTMRSAGTGMQYNLKGKIDYFAPSTPEAVCRALNATLLMGENLGISKPEMKEILDALGLLPEDR